MSRPYQDYPSGELHDLKREHTKNAKQAGRDAMLARDRENRKRHAEREANHLSQVSAIDNELAIRRQMRTRSQEIADDPLAACMKAIESAVGPVTGPTVERISVTWRSNGRDYHGTFNARRGTLDVMVRVAEGTEGARRIGRYWYQAEQRG